MKTVNINNPEIDKLRNIVDFNGLDYTLSCKKNSDIKRLAATLENETIGKSRKNKINVKCPGCNHRFKSVDGKIPEHKIHTTDYNETGGGYRTSKTICDQKTKGFQIPVKVGTKNSCIINKQTVQVGDEIIFYAYPYHDFLKVGRDDVLIAEVKEIVAMSDNSIAVHLKGYDIPMRTTWFGISTEII